jgi:hypothetical protein
MRDIITSHCKTNSLMTINSRPRQSEGGFLERPLIQEFYFCGKKKDFTKLASVGCSCLHGLEGLEFDAMTPRETGFVVEFFRPEYGRDREAGLAQLRCHFVDVICSVRTDVDEEDR